MTKITRGPRWEGFAVKVDLLAAAEGGRSPEARDCDFIHEEGQKWYYVQMFDLSLGRFAQCAGCDKLGDFGAN